MFKSTNGVCSHSLLVATLNGEMDTFVQSHSKTRKPINYTELAQHGLPVGGKKPGSKRKALAKKTTAKTRKVLADTDVRTKRGQSSLSNSSTSDSSAASPQTPNVYSVLHMPILLQCLPRFQCNIHCLCSMLHSWLCTYLLFKCRATR